MGQADGESLSKGWPLGESHVVQEWVGTSTHHAQSLDGAIIGEGWPGCDGSGGFNGAAAGGCQSTTLPTADSLEADMSNASLRLQVNQFLS